MATTIRTLFFTSRRRHTRLQGAWSSDVCSSDLDELFGEERLRLELADSGRPEAAVARVERALAAFAGGIVEIGRASCRGRGEISGGAGSLKKKKDAHSRCEVTRHVYIWTR